MALVSVCDATESNHPLGIVQRDEEAAEDEEDGDPELAMMLGFSGFGSSKR
jgi:hypothetical protein